jgi:hypothetical protein
VKNPATRFLEWKSNDKCFAFYNKETGENEKVNLPLKFVHLTDKHTVRGFNEKNNCGVYANEVGLINDEALNVRLSKGDVSIKGLYKDIKGKILELGGKYTKSLYVLDADNNIINIQLQGAALASWSEFSKDERRKFGSNFIIVEGFEAKKKGSVKYNTPTFVVGEEIDGETILYADQAFDVLDIFFNSKGTSGSNVTDNNNGDEPVEEDYAPVAVGEDEDDLPF